MRFPPVKSRLIKVAAVIGAAVVLSVLYARFSRTIRLDSDDAAVLLETRDFLAGNYLLRGWITGYFSGYVTKLPYYAIGIESAGFRPSLLHTVPGIVYALLVLISLCLVYLKSRPGEALVAIGIAFAILGLPWHWASVLLPARQHTGTFVLMIAALVCIAVIDKRPQTRWRYAIFFILLTAAVFDDKLAFYVGVIPILVVLAARMILAFPRIRPHEAVLAGLALLSLPIEFAATTWIANQGGFRATPPHAALAASGAALLHNLTLEIQGLLLLFGANWSVAGSRWLIDPIATVHLLGVAVVASALWRIATRFFRRQDSGDLVLQILALGIIFDLASYVFSDLAVNLATTRYLSPTLIYGAIIGGIETSWLFSARAPRLLAASAAAVYVAAFASILFAPIRGLNHDDLATVKWLREHRLVNGVGDYWGAGILTVESRDTVRVRQVLTNSQGLFPYYWAAKSQWYDRRHGFNFVVIDETQHDSVSVSNVERIFGSPARRIDIGHYTILVWNRDLPVPPISASP